MRLLLGVLCAATLSVSRVSAGAACGCKAAHDEPRLVPDPSAEPPDWHEGQPRQIPDPTKVRPVEWDDADDGPWEAAPVANPAYRWAPPLVANPKYRPPASYLEDLTGEVLKAAPWVTMGLAAAALLGVFQAPVAGLASALRRGGGRRGVTGGANDASGAGGVSRANRVPTGGLPTWRGPLRWLQGLLGRLRGLAVGAGLGLATPLCSCGGLPVATSLLAAGAPLPTVVSFLTASQASPPQPRSQAPRSPHHRQLPHRVAGTDDTLLSLPRSRAPRS